MVSEPVEARRRTTQVGGEEQRGRHRIPRLSLKRDVVRTRLVDPRAPAGNRGEEPHLVLLDRAAELRAGPEDALNLGARIDAERPETIVDIRALHVGVRVIPVDAATKGVAAALGNRVEGSAAGAGFRAHAGGLQLQLL